MNLIKRIPILPTLLVLIAAGVMIRLGFWQLDRLHQKETLIAQFTSAQNHSIQPLPPQPDTGLVSDTQSGRMAMPEQYLVYRFRRYSFECPNPVWDGAFAGRNTTNQIGWAHRAKCMPAGRASFYTVAGWSTSPSNPPNWSGGKLVGTVVPGERSILTLVAETAPQGLEQLKRPDPNDLLNNHLSYAVQWFLFAATALVIYALALRKRLAAGASGG